MLESVVGLGIILGMWAAMIVPLLIAVAIVGWAQRTAKHERV